MTIDPLQPYRDAVDEHGACFKATLWGSPATQALRFDVMLDMIAPDPGSDDRVLDLGCGDGALARHIRDRGCAAFVTGFDGIEAMVEAATARGIADTAFEYVDLAGDWPQVHADWVFISGTLNTMDDKLTSRVLDAAWAAADTGLVFNMLGDAPDARWQDAPLGPARRHDVARLQAWAGDRAARVTMRDDYLQGHDVTLAMWRA